MPPLAGRHVHPFAPPIERLDFQCLADGPELRALLYAALWQLTGPGQHTAALIVGLPVEIVQDKALTVHTLRTLRGWLLGSHHFTVDGEPVTLTIVAVKGLAQPVGSYFAWGANLNGAWQLSREARQKPVAICDIGFNTLDLFAVENGQVFGRFTAAHLSISGACLARYPLISLFTNPASHRQPVNIQPQFFRNLTQNEWFS